MTTPREPQSTKVGKEASLTARRDDNRGAVFSRCRKYRYVLRRKLPRPGPRLLGILLNPSYAGEVDNDRTTRRNLGFASLWGFGHFTACNLHAYICTDSRQLRHVHDPIGSENDLHLVREIDRADKVFVAWGALGGMFGRDRIVSGMLPPGTWCLGFTKHGQPRFPLYLPANTVRVPFIVSGKDT